MPLNTDFSVPRLVHAIFKAHACCEEDECEDSLARCVKVAELKLVCGKHKQLALEAEQVLGRLKKVFDASDRSATLEYGELSIQIAGVVLGKEKDTTVNDRT